MGVIKKAPATQPVYTRLSKADMPTLRRIMRRRGARSVSDVVGQIVTEAIDRERRRERKPKERDESTE